MAFSFSSDAGRLVENVVHNHLRRCHEEVYFGADGGETDFVLKEGVAVTRRIQVWYEDAPQAEIPERELAAFRDLQEDSAEWKTLLIRLRTQHKAKRRLIFSAKNRAIDLSNG
ncbi:MAG TPA: hypothetical protein VJ955_01320 [Desulfuromonadales bacterium]|nr:hypothetical protein [Desulfuromonadales bacterium]